MKFFFIDNFLAFIDKSYFSSTNAFFFIDNCFFRRQWFFFIDNGKINLEKNCHSINHAGLKKVRRVTALQTLFEITDMKILKPTILDY